MTSKEYEVIFYSIPTSIYQSELKEAQEKDPKCTELSDDDFIDTAESLGNIASIQGVCQGYLFSDDFLSSEIRAYLVGRNMSYNAPVIRIDEAMSFTISKVGHVK